jgi:hypothetical protein
VERAGAVDSLGIGPNGTLQDTSPSGVVCEVPRRAIINTSSCCVISVLVATAGQLTSGVEDIAISELSGEGTGCHATLGDVLGEVVDSSVDHGAGTDAYSDRRVVRVAEGVHVSGLGAHLNTGPGGVVSK